VFCGVCVCVCVSGLVKIAPHRGLRDTPASIRTGPWTGSETEREESRHPLSPSPPQREKRVGVFVVFLFGHDNLFLFSFCLIKISFFDVFLHLRKQSTMDSPWKM
jgi:hypothetical protein